MISVMDQGIGKIVKAIEEKGIMNNTIIIFFSDNGGPTRGMHATEASNFPIRGVSEILNKSLLKFFLIFDLFQQKGSIWEGGCRVVACVYSPLIKASNRVSKEFIHVADLLPTLAGAANIEINDKSLDGINQWETIAGNYPSPRNEILYNIENINGYSAIVHEGWKLVNGSENINNSNWFGSSGIYYNISFDSYVKNILESDTSKHLPGLNSALIQSLRLDATLKCTYNQEISKCNPLKAPCLFNLIEDPCEQNNLAESHKAKLDFLQSRLSFHIKNVLPTRRRFKDAKCDPINFNNTWNWWQDDERDINDQTTVFFKNQYVYAFCIFIFAILSCIVFMKNNNKNRPIKL